MNALANIWDLVLTEPFRMTEESFWEYLLGERVLTLLKHWIDNDVVFYAIVTGPFNRLMAYIGTRFNSYWYCTIKVKQNEYDAYNALQWYVASQLGEESFRHVEKIFFIVVSWLYHFFDNDRKLGYKKNNYTNYNNFGRCGPICRCDSV